MKLTPDIDPSLNTITAYDGESVDINAVRYTSSVIVLPTGPVIEWPVADFAALAPQDFAALEQAAPELVILGTGQRQRFAHPRLTASLINARIGVESMDSGAACRTYNILVNEGRRAAIALIIEPTR